MEEAQAPAMEVMVEEEMGIAGEVMTVKTQSLEGHSSSESSACSSGGLFLPYCSAVSFTTGCKLATGASN